MRKGMLYLGTDNALYVSWDDGGALDAPAQQPAAGAGVLAAGAADVQRPRDRARTVAACYILDDVTPLREWDAAQAQDVHLFKPRPAYRFRRVDDGRRVDAGGHVIGENPPYGADINFWLKSRRRATSSSRSSSSTTRRSAR